MATELEESRYTPEERAKILSTLVMDGEQLAAVTGTFAGRSSPGMSWVSLLQAQRKQFQTVVVENNLKPVEGVLLAQAVTLNAIFADFAERAALNVGEYPEAVERYMRLALKAQAQSRATLEALAEVKNPLRSAYVRQANIANGPQQVNNGCAGAETVNAQSKLLEAEHVQWVDTGKAAAPGRGNQDVESVGAIHGTAHRRRKGPRKPERVERRGASDAA